MREREKLLGEHFSALRALSARSLKGSSLRGWEVPLTRRVLGRVLAEVEATWRLWASACGW